MSTKVIVGISGASGAVYGWRLLQRLRAHGGVEIHLILTRSGEKTLFLETGKTVSDLKVLSDFSYPMEDISCRLASGSYPTDAMVIAPCSDLKRRFSSKPAKPFPILRSSRIFLIQWRIFPAAWPADPTPPTPWSSPPAPSTPCLPSPAASVPT